MSEKSQNVVNASKSALNSSQVSFGCHDTQKTSSIKKHAPLPSVFTTESKNAHCSDYFLRYALRLLRIGCSPMKAIKLKCFECSGYFAQVANSCNCRTCALWILLRNRRIRKGQGVEL